jgi:hypothetical protein
MLESTVHLGSCRCYAENHWRFKPHQLQLLPPVFQLVNYCVLDKAAAFSVSQQLAVGIVWPKQHLPQLQSPHVHYIMNYFTLD